MGIPDDDGSGAERWMERGLGLGRWVGWFGWFALFLVFWNLRERICNELRELFYF